MSIATQDYRMVIGGAWAESESGARFEATSPATGESLGTVPEGTREDVQRAIAADLKAGLRDRYRVEASSYGHWEIPRNYGWRILANPAADVPRATREPANGDGHGSDRTRHRQRSPGGARVSG